jgi:psp operon transcriptional activator
VDVRIVAATNEHLPKLVQEGRFRADLLDRLSFEVVTLPPLRARKGDIALLAEHFGRRMAVELDWPNWPGFSDRTVAQLEEYSWPGNVRELRNAIERAVYRAEDPERAIDEIQFDPFASPWALNPDPAGAVEVAAHGAHSHPAATEAAAAAVAPPASTNDLRGAVNAYEKALLEEALAKNRFNQRTTATALGLSYDQLRHAMKRHQLAVSN